MRRLGGGTLVLLLVALLAWRSDEDPARAVPFAQARAAVVAAAAVMRELVPPPGLTPIPPESFPYRVVERLALGEASYYARTLEGRLTASGEPYHGSAMTAAHRTLPFGTLLRVTNLRNRRSVIVRVNDRGPYRSHRVLDLSAAAAREIGMFHRGCARVKVELVRLLDPAGEGDATPAVAARR